MAINQEYNEYRVLELPQTGYAGDRYYLNVGGGKYQTYIVSDSLELTKEAGNEFIECDTVDDLRALDSRQIWAIQNGYYKGVKLNGYYSEGDTPAPIEYILSDTVESEDGGSVFEVGGIKLDHEFASKIDSRYFGVRSNIGSIPQTEVIQNAIDSAARLGKRIYFSAGLRYVDGRYNSGGRGILVPSNSDIECDENAVFKVTPQTSGSYTAFSFVEVDNIYINHLNLIGDNDEHLGSSGEWGMGISILSSSNIIIDYVKATKFWGDGIYLGRLVPDDERPTIINNNITIRNSELSHCRRQGMSVVTVDGLYMDNISIDTIIGAAPEAGIDFEPNTPIESIKNVVIGKVFCRNAANYAVIFVFHNLDSTSEPVDIQIGEIICEVNGAVRVSGDNYTERRRGLVTIGVIRSTNARGHVLNIYNIKNSVDMYFGDIYIEDANQAESVYPFGAAIRIYAQSSSPVMPEGVPNNYKINNIYSKSSDGKITKIIDVYEHNIGILTPPSINLDILGEIKGEGINPENTKYRIKSAGKINYQGLRNTLFQGDSISLTSNTPTLLTNDNFDNQVLFPVNNMPFGWELKIELKKDVRIGIANSNNFRLFRFQDTNPQGIASAVPGSAITLVHLGDNVWDIKDMIGRWFYGTILLSNVIIDSTIDEKGVIQLASQVEVNNGVNVVKAITPATLQGKLNGMNATPTEKGLVNQAVAVPNGSSIDDLLAALRTAGILAT